MHHDLTQALASHGVKKRGERRLHNKFWRMVVGVDEGLVGLADAGGSGCGKLASPWEPVEGGGKHLRIFADAKREGGEEAASPLTAGKGAPIAAKGPASF